jgi:hypothetical protein
MCKPREYLEERTDGKKKQRLQDIFGTGDLSDDTLKPFIKKDWFLPRDRMECYDQLHITILFMDLLTVDKSIGAAGYRYGLKLLRDHQVRFTREAKNDKHFHWKFLHLLDTAFQ